MARTSGFTSGDLPDAAVHVLLALTGPRHGYAIMRFLEEVSDGAVAVGPASLYTTLKKLLDAGLIAEVASGDHRRVYQMTPVGREALDRDIDRRRRLVAMAEHIMEDAS